MKVTVYGTKTCPWCKKTREFLEKHKIKFNDVHVEDDKKAADEMIKKSGQQSVPVIDVDGKIILGYDVEKLKDALKIKW
ncbi:glutathione S-transferase N-terminal domain-containing protein [Candidatus Woesearchaeota archaeon]|nr:glutathione S-transferase N-terminal domain-containing protein [Candidatus Woesearchaeota archaeon]